MTLNVRILTVALSVLATSAYLLPQKSHATVVEFQTVMGNFEVNLYDNATPTTVANFLDYVNNGAYTSSIMHRSVPGFIVQGGGFNFNLAWPATAIPANAPIANEPVFSNLRGTIAMAKTSQPDSATNQWFFNLGDNSANLDLQNEGFTAFGEVVGNGMDVVDAIAALQRFPFAVPFNELPLRSDNGGNPDATNLVIVTAIVVTDTTVDSAGAAGLTPTPNTLINQPPPTLPPPTSGGGGGTINILLLLVLLTNVMTRLARRRTF